MNNPVLLPKRKDYGFLKAPPSLKNLKLVNQSTTTTATSLNPYNTHSNQIPTNTNNVSTASLINSGSCLPNGRHLMHFRLTNKTDYIGHTCKQISINHKLDNIQIKYELKNPNFLRSMTNKSKSAMYPSYAYTSNPANTTNTTSNPPTSTSPPLQRLEKLPLSSIANRATTPTQTAQYEAAPRHSMQG